MKKYEISMCIPTSIYKKLDKILLLTDKEITSTKSMNNFKNSFWAISCYMINKCGYENDNLNFFVNIGQNDLENLTGQKTKIITAIKSWLFTCGIFECNFNKCHSGPKTFTYGYRLHPGIQNEFTSKSLHQAEFKKISFLVPDNFLIREFNLNIDCLNRIKNCHKLNLERLLYIKVGEDSIQSIDNEEDGNFYSDREEMNEYESLLASRMKRITVNINKLFNHEGNDLKKLYWLGRIMKSKDDEVKFSHGRLYRNPYWHCLPKEFRHYCEYDKKYSIREGFDVKNCFATLLLKIIEGKVSEQEYNKYKRIVRSGIYEDIAGFTTKFDRDDMKQPFCHWLFSNNHTKKLALNERFVIVRNYFKNEFPEIYNLVTNYKEIESIEKNKKVKKSKLSVDCQWIENELVLNTLCKWTEEKYNVEVWTLHDAICCKDEDYNKIDWCDVKQMWYNIMNLI